MELDRATIAQVVVSVIAVAMFVAGLVVISTMYGSDSGEGVQISSEGGMALLGLMAVFIIVMPALGYMVERMKSDEDGAG
jgi:uncharacterized membrane protein